MSGILAAIIPQSFHSFQHDQDNLSLLLIDVVAIIDSTVDDGIRIIELTILECGKATQKDQSTYDSNTREYN